MKKIVHLSDLHFGRIDAGLVEPLVEAVNATQPTLVVVSGDLTQRARSQQFKEARAFLDRLHGPQVVVPGNHDVPLYNVLERFVAPARQVPALHLGGARAGLRGRGDGRAGVNTARSLTRKFGRINERQVERLRERLCKYPDGVLKVVVTHHPFDVAEGADEREIVGRARMAMEALAACGADLLLAGHMHVSQTGRTAERYRIHGHSALFVQAGTATSTRGRGEAELLQRHTPQAPAHTGRAARLAAGGRPVRARQRRDLPPHPDGLGAPPRRGRRRHHLRRRRHGSATARPREVGSRQMAVGS